MADFYADMFARLLKEAPPKRNVVEQPEYSDHLNKQVFVPLREGKGVVLKELDWTAFELSHVTPKDYGQGLDETARGWAKGLNERIQSIAAVSDASGAFF